MYFYYFIFDKNVVSICIEIKFYNFYFCFVNTLKPKPTKNLFLVHILNSR